MSYTIFYRSMFVKTSDNKYIPIIEGGDNNCYEAGSMRRARSWYSISSITKEPKALLTAKEIMDGVERCWVKTMKEQNVGKPMLPRSSSNAERTSASTARETNMKNELPDKGQAKITRVRNN